MRTIKLMADYQCYPLWEVSPSEVGNIDPSTLPISEDLKRQLMKWAFDYDATLNLDDPVSSGFKSEKEEVAFIGRGKELGAQLQSELGKEFIIKIKI